MRAWEEVRDQRVAILAGTWVRTHPFRVGEACAGFRVAETYTDEEQVNAARYDEFGDEVAYELVLGPVARRAVAWAIAELGREFWVPEQVSAEFPDIPLLQAIQLWNDDLERTPGEVLEVLDRGETIAKEAECEATE